MEKPVIYTIMVIEKLEEFFIQKEDEDGNTFEVSSGFNKYGDTRVWGFYMDKERAIETIESNMLDIHETCYDYACLEAYEEGITHPITKETMWFKFDKKEKVYVKIPTPELEKKVCCRAMG